MPSLKEEVLKSVQSLPDECSMDDIFYQLYLMHKIKTGREQAEKGELLDHEDVVKEAEKW